MAALLSSEAQKASVSNSEACQSPAQGPVKKSKKARSSEICQSSAPEPAKTSEKVSGSEVCQAPAPEPLKKSKKARNREVCQSPGLEPAKESEKMRSGEVCQSLEPVKESGKVSGSEAHHSQAQEPVKESEKVRSSEACQSPVPEPAEESEKLVRGLEAQHSPVPEPDDESEKVGTSEVHQPLAQEPVKESETSPVPLMEGMVGWLSRSKTLAYSLAKEKVVALLVVAQMQVERTKAFMTDSVTRFQDGAQVVKTSVEEKTAQLRAGAKVGYHATLEWTGQVKIYIFSTYESTMAKASAVKGAAAKCYKAAKTEATKGGELANWTYQNPKEAAANVQMAAYDSARQAWDKVASFVENCTTSAKEMMTSASTKVHTKAFENYDYAFTTASALKIKAGEVVETSKWAVINPKEAGAASITAVKERLVRVQTGAADACDKALETAATCKAWTHQTYDSYKERAIQTYITAKEVAIAKKDEAADNVSHAVEVTSTKISEVSRSTKVAVTNPKSQAIAASACAGGAALGATGGAAGFVAGGTAGAMIGVVPALFTFGLSIPIGAAIGAGLGSTVGAVGGGAVGAVSGGIAGSEVYERRGDIMSSASSTWSKACEYSEGVKSSTAERMTQVRQRLYKPAGTSKPVAETATVQ